MVSFVERGSAASLLITPAPGAKGHAAAPPFASLGWGMLSMGASQTAKLKERRTGVEFDGTFGRGQIAGAGARTKKIAGIKSLNIYALALYVDERAAKRALGHKFAGRAAAQISHDALLGELMTAGNVEKSLLLIITSGLVNRANFLEALDGRLAPALARAKQSAVLQDFRAQFDSVDIRKGLPIAFTFNSGRVITQAGGKQVGAIANQALAAAMLDAYLGSDPVSKDAKESFGKGLAGMVAA